jgi:ACS family hexuronate transporter-like MFS transporter
MFLFCGLGYLLAWFIMFRLLVPEMTPVVIERKNKF